MSLAQIFGNSVKTYDPLSVSVVFGVIPIGGFSSGSAIKVAREEQAYRKIVGINGFVSRTHNLNKSGQISLTLAQTSLSNTALSALAITDELTGSVVLPFIILDTGSGSTVVSAKAWIRKPTDLNYGKDLETREWVFDCADIDIIASGNIGTNLS